MTHTSVTQKCPYFPHLGPVGCLPAPNIFPLAKETFAKGKMFWNAANEAHSLDKIDENKASTKINKVIKFKN